MVVGEPNINNIMSGLENTGGVKQHNHKKKLKQRFDIIKKLGQGTFGKVQLGINKETGQEVAIKTIKKSKIESEADLIRIRREIQIMSSVQHPNIIHIYEVFENREKMVLVMEYAAGGELYDYLSERKVLQEEEARRIFRQIATACYYCHKHKICHRDLKLENILLDENNNAKIADFGLSNVFDEQRLLNTFCGSPLYASPEIVKGTPYHGPEVDCWSLGVLLYTLVYGAMPFDGSNFKRLVKQISQGDYFEPTKPSPASPLIKDMLTVNPKARADIEKICSHWWVNEGYDENCLDISEELANQTPVRLDLLLSLAPPPPQLESEKLVVTGDATEDAGKTEIAGCTRSQSVGSLMELSHSAEKRIIDMLKDEKVSPKRKLETTVSTDRANLDREGLKRKEKIVKENTVADITVHGTIHETESQEDASMGEASPLNKSLTQTLSRDMEVEPSDEALDPSLQGAVCSEILEDAKKAEKKQSQAAKIKKTLSVAGGNKMLEGINEIPSQENVANNVDKENVEHIAQKPKQELQEEKAESKAPAKRKVVKKKVLSDKNENEKPKELSSQSEPVKVEDKADDMTPKDQVKAEEAPSKPIERRRSRIFEAAEKFQNLISPTESKPAVTEKPKKILIPGVSVDGFKKEFERKASLTSTSPPKLKGTVSKKHIIEAQPSIEQEQPEVKTEAQPQPTKPAPVASANNERANKTDEVNDERKERVRNAVNIISSALDMDGTRKSKSRPCMMRKPPVPFGVSGRSASGNIGMITAPLSPPIGPKPFVRPQFDSEVKQVTPQPEPVEENQTSSAEITLKSATLPRRKTTKAEIQLNYPMPKPATMEFKTEMSHPIEAHPKLATQRSEVIVPVGGHPNVGFRSASVEPEMSKQSPRERIIPISFEKSDAGRETVQSPPAKPPMPRSFQTQRSVSSQRSNSLSRQSTQESDTETVTSNGEPIRKSPREYIIPIAVEGGGYVTPRAGSLEPSETGSTTSTMTNLSKSRFGRPRRLNSRLSDRDSEDESPFAALHRHSSFGKDSDTEDSKRDTFHMHRLRSTRPKRTNLEHNDSLSSGEEDDDDGFELLTAENLFSTLLSRVRDLTQRLNVEDSGRPGFPSSRLLSHFDHGTNFWNLRNRMEPLSRHSSLGRSFSRERSTENSTGSNLNAPWRRSVSRDLASDIDSVFKDQENRPRGDKTEEENLNLADLNLKKLKLSDEDALALSYLTPGLSKRIQKQLLAQLAPSEARKLHRTLSSRNSSDNPYESNDESKFVRRSAERLTSTLPRRFSADKVSYERKSAVGQENVIPENEQVTDNKSYKSFLPVKSQIRFDRRERRPYSDFSVRSASIEYEPSYRRPKVAHSISLREPRSGSRACDTNNAHSPDSSMSESLSQNDSSSYKRDTDSVSDVSGKTYTFDNYTALSRPSPAYARYATESSSFNRYLSPTKSLEHASLPTPHSFETNKTELQRPSSTRRVSRFLRPDFFDPPKEEKENVFLKEKKEREMETQKVLKEIRDKRKSRLHIKRERSKSREKSLEPSMNENDTNKFTSSCANGVTEKPTTKNFLDNKNDVMKETNKLLDNVSNNIKNLESNVNSMMHDYVNVPNTGKMENPKVMPDYVNVPKENTNDTVDPIVKKERVSKIARPKSYPTENSEKVAAKISPDKVVTKVRPEKVVASDKNMSEKTIAKVSPEKDTKMSRLRKGFVRQGSKEKEKEKTKADKNDINKNANADEKCHKNKLLQTIEKKLEKFRASASPKSSEEVKEKKSSVETAIRKLREQSLPRNLEPCTESGLIKRAVSVEDLSNFSGNKPLQASRKSVTKILGLFKKYEEQENKKNDKVLKKKKVKENGKSDDIKSTKLKKSSDKKSKETVIVQNNSNSNDKNVNSQEVFCVSDNPECKNNLSNDIKTSVEPTGTKPERPRSLLLDKMKHFQQTNGAKSDIVNDKESKVKSSKLPVNTFRRSLNLENMTQDTSRFKQSAKTSSSESQLTEKNGSNSRYNADKFGGMRDKPDRRNLVLDFSKVPNTVDPKIVIEPTPSTSGENTKEFVPPESRNSLTTDDSSVFLSPCDDNVSDSWSICSDYHSRDLCSPVSPTNGHLYSGDESESVIDRIRRKSFYTRFNENKRIRRPSLRNYKDLDLYKDVYKSPSDYGSLDRRTYDYHKPVSRRSSCASSVQDPKDYKQYARSSSVLNDYINVPNRYQTYSSKIGRPASHLYSDSEDNTLDDLLSAAKSKKYSTPTASRIGRKSTSPINEQYFVDHPSSSATSNLASPTSSEPV